MGSADTAPGTRDEEFSEPKDIEEWECAIHNRHFCQCDTTMINLYSEDEEEDYDASAKDARCLGDWLVKKTRRTKK